MILVEHPGLVDNEQRPPVEPWGVRRGLAATPAAVVVPPVAVLVQQRRD